MKKIVLLIVSCTALYFNSCKENIPSGLTLATNTTLQKDTDYVLTTIPTPQLKNILVEEFTGVACANCPVGAALAKSVENANMPRVIVAKLHSNFLATPLLTTDPDLRCTEAEAVYNNLGGNVKPSFTINRVYDNSLLLYTFDKDNFLNNFNLQLAKKNTFVNIDLAKSINNTQDSISLVSTFTFTDSTSNHLAYQIYLIENDVIAAQDSGSSGIVLNNFHHEQILRKSITPAVVGTNLKDTLQQAGKVYVKAVTFAKPSNVINLSNCEIIVFINNRDTKEVIHCMKVHL